MNAKSTLRFIGFVLAVAVLLLGGAGITGAAAQSAIPGDALYPVKTTIETTRLSLAQDAGSRAQMNLTFAEQRLAEISGLIREGRVREIRSVVLAFEAHINAAIMELETISAHDSARAAGIAQDVTSALTRYARTLSELAASAPESIRPEVARALDTTQIVTGMGSEKMDDNSNASLDDNGNDSSSDDLSSNANSNDDSSLNANVNSNSNDNASDDRRYDDNSNAYEDHRYFDNSNASDDNSSSSFDDNGNDNSSSSTSIDDSSMNANDNSTDDHSGGGGSDDSSSNSNDDSGGRSGKGGKGK